MKVGIVVTCAVCHRQKQPRGRSAPIGSNMCEPPCAFIREDGCDGYHQEPRVGDLWLGETEDDFGYPVSSDGTREVTTV